MRTFAISAIRIVLACSVVAALGIGGLLGWQRHGDQQFLGDLARVQQSTDNYAGTAFHERMELLEPITCQRLAGISTRVSLARMTAWTNGVERETSERHATGISKVRPPARWDQFHALLQQRHLLLQALVVAQGVAREREQELAEAHANTPELAYVEILANDREYRDAVNEATAILGQIGVQVPILREAMPPRASSSKALDRELEVPDLALADLGNRYESATNRALVNRSRAGAGTSTATLVASTGLAPTAAPTSTPPLPGVPQPDCSAQPRPSSDGSTARKATPVGTLG